MTDETTPRPQSETGEAPPRRRVLATVLAYARSRAGGGMLIASAFVVSMMFLVGGLLVDYSWRDAQFAEVESAVRAAVSSAVRHLLLRGNLSDDLAKEQIAEFATGAAPGLDVKPTDVSIVHHSDGSSTVVVGGNYAFNRLFGTESVEAVATDVRFRADATFYEVAIAVEQDANTFTELFGNMPVYEAIAQAAERVVEGMEALPAGHMMVSVVPFGQNVRVADTCSDPANPGGPCTAARTPGKETYVRLLMGINGTIDDALARGRQDRAAGRRGHWVDVYHQYGTGADMGPLAHQYLPDDLLDGIDWNLRRTAVDIDVSDQLPIRETWTVDDEDFWNGCVMARWGAYWRDDARPPAFIANDPGNWPVRRAVGAWSPDVGPLPVDTPVHLSDAPPYHGDPNTLFTAYSYPDARIAWDGDHRLELTMTNLLDPGYFSEPLFFHNRTPDIDWSATGLGGSLGCNLAPIVPLTAEVDTVRATAATRTAPSGVVFDRLYHDYRDWLLRLSFPTEPIRDLTRVQGYWVCETDLTSIVPDGCYHTVHDRGPDEQSVAVVAHNGVTWGLRALSPLWQEVWGATDPAGNPRPARSCDGGPRTGCLENLHKTIVLLTRKPGFRGLIRNSQLIDRQTVLPWNVETRYVNGVRQRSATRPPQIVAGPPHPHIQNVSCHGAGGFLVRDPNLLSDYSRAARASTEAVFHQYFQNLSLVDPSGRFTALGREQFARLLHRSDPAWTADDPDRLAAIERLLDDRGWTAWQVFRELDPEVVDALMDPMPNGDPTEPESPMGFVGRPSHLGHYCEFHTWFDSYGRVRAPVRVGEVVPGQAPVPVRDVSFWWTGERVSDDGVHIQVEIELAEQGAEEFIEACRVAGLRKVKIIVMYLQNPHSVVESFSPLVMERCITANGGDPLVDIVWAPDPATLDAHFKNIFVDDVRRLRFTN